MDARETLRTRLDAEGLDWLVPDWDAPATIVAVSTTRCGREGAVASFLPSPPVYLRQVHGTRVVEIDGRSRAEALAESPAADAAIAREPGIAVAVRSADCLPVLFADRRGTVVAAAHAGWRGLAAGVLESTVDAMGVAAHDVVAWIGPAIGPRRFEVGRDVYDAYVDADAGDAACFAPHRDGKWLADLPGLARRRLANVGVHAVAGGRWCTVEDAARFHSWRRDRGTGRMATAIAIEKRQAEA